MTARMPCSNTAAQPCRCRAYKFPHRLLSGKCGEREERGGNRTERDNCADDPRHGQAADINRFR